MKNIFIAAAAVILAATPALASDVDAKSDFEGFYVGLVTGVSPILDGYDPAWAGGITLGYNWNVADSVILGIEGDLMGGSWEGFAYANDSLRLRAGLEVADGFMLYGTGGIGATGLEIYGVQEIGYGFVGGGGIEMMIGHGVSLKAEGLYRGDTESFEFRSGVNFNF